MTTLSTHPSPTGGRPGFVADLGFLFIIPWLLLWRYELTDASSRSLWTGWAPAMVVPLLCAVAIAIGVAQRQPRGFLPYRMRWAGLAAVLVLPAWIAFAIADASDRAPGLRDIAQDIRTSAEAGLATATTPEDKRVHETAIKIAEAEEKLAAVTEKTEARGGAVPSEDDSSDASDASDPETRKLLAQAQGIASALAHEAALSQEFAEEAAEAGLDEAQMILAVIGIAAAILAPYIGLSPEVLTMLLQLLIADGDLSLGNIVKITTAVASSTRADGTLDQSKLLASMKRTEALAQQFQVLLDAAEKAGGDRTRETPLFRIARSAVDDAATPARGKLCFDKVLRESPDKSGPDLERLLKRECGDLTVKQIKRLVNDRAGVAR